MGDQTKREFNTQPGVVVSSRWNPTPEQLRTLEELYRRGTRTPPADQVRWFLVVHQNDINTRIEDAQHIVEQVVSRRHPMPGIARNSLSLDDFFCFLFCDDLNGPIRTQGFAEWCSSHRT
ncbi:hypothetical protein F3Y22_tig00002799pilonHSYRG00129 [Hibiscus syriacus]|uniref:Uncharacterized protein n=1 Tax=Hibiscus syriacus TaxID=106335 RepID=A0A6A3CRE4_HIBSY|nr:hypothetical protein F3Y22_tig00002799pilonHSYRG00129 [Hibiscus syriacus]